MTLTLNKNIKKDKALAEKMTAGDLNCIDCFKLAAAVQLSELFPSAPVYLVPQQQTKPIQQLPPAVFVQTTNIHREKRLGGEHEYTIGVNIAYMSQDVNAQTEQEAAAVKLMDMAESIPPLPGMEYPYSLYVSDARTVDGIVNITGTTSVWERWPDNTPLIEEAGVNVNTEAAMAKGRNKQEAEVK